MKTARNRLFLMKRTIFLMVLILALLLAGCSSSQAASQEVAGSSVGASSPESTPESQAGGYLTTDYEDALSLSNQLALGTLRLEGTAQAVTPDQAQSLLVFWQAYAALSSSGTTAAEELTSVENQILEAMTDEQQRAIAELRLTSADLGAFYAEQGVGDIPTPPPGVTPGSMSEEEREAFRATAEASGAIAGSAEGSSQSRQSILANELVALLTERADS